MKRKKMTRRKRNVLKYNLKYLDMKLSSVVIDRAEIKREKVGIIDSVDVNISTGEASISKEGNFEVKFRYSANYKPDIGSIVIEGRVILSGTKGEVEKAYKVIRNTKSGRPPKKFLSDVMGIAFFQCITVATVLAKAIDMPAPLPKPTFTERK